MPGSFRPPKYYDLLRDYGMKPGYIDHCCNIRPSSSRNKSLTVADCQYFASKGSNQVKALSKKVVPPLAVESPKQSEHHAGPYGNK